ncbi:MAG TPA: fibronectin type III domain-containing protein, partial [Chitinophagales bacterium]|nr:fibronectin type III domain-containing protein [Chitinophagales bacterium]
GTFSVSSVSNGAGSFTLTTNYTPTAVDPEWPSPVFYWSTGETAGQIATAAGFYSVTVSPISGCEETASIIAGSQFQIQLDDVYVPWCDWNNTFIAPTIDGGEAPYTYLWNTGDTDEQIDNTQPGIYSVTVTDANGLTASDDAVVTTDAIAMIPSPLEINCDSGVINATVTVLEGGMAPYSFLWSNGDADGHTIFEHGTLYNLTITDANGCSIEYTDMFFGYAVVVDSVINATCGLPDGAAYIGIEEFNSIGDFQYAWSNGSTSEDLTGVPEGIYNVTVTDFMGCTVDETVEVNCNGTSLQLNMIVTNDPCSAQSGSIEVTVTGGTPPYTFTWSNGSTDASLFNITAGAYELTVTDVVGSTVSGSALVFASDPPSLTIATTDATCISGGLVDLTVSGGLAPYSFIWSNGATTEDLLDASPGDYTVTVSTIDGCEAIGSAEILPPGLITPPTVVVTYSPVIACVNLPATLEVTEIYQSYEWSTGETTASIQTFNAGYHFVTVTDASGCTAVTEAIIISYLPPLPVNIIAPVPGCGATSVTLSTDMTAQSYVWSTGETTPTITVTANGTYGVTIVDLAGCELWDEVIVTFIPPVSVWINPINPGCGATNGAINLTVSGGTAPFSFIWSTGETSEDLSGVPSGTYNVTVTDANGCTAFESVVLADATVCGAPTNPTAAVNNTTAVIQWDAQPCAVKYRVLVKQMGAAGGPWVMHFVNAPNVTLTLTGLTPGKMYKYRVRAVCSPTGSVLSPWSVTNTFTAAGNVSACVPPASITATNPTPNGAIVNWTSVAGSYGYQLRYRVQGSVSWTPVVINNGAAGSQTLTGLQSNTTYEFQMRTKCAVGPVTWSTYSPIQSFATALRLSEAEAVRVSVYPNPANGLVDITLNESLNATIELISVEGKLLQRIETIANATIDVSDVANGLYLLRIITQNGERHERIVVQH